MYLEHNGQKYNSGDNIIFKIRKIALKGKLYINERDDRYYLCHNDDNFSGSTSPNLLGFQFSWVFNNYSGFLSDEVEIISKYDKDKDNFKISNDLFMFFKIYKSEILLLLESTNILSNYNRVDTSSTLGMILLEDTNTGRKVEMKIGRLLNTICKLINIKIKQSDIESIHNSYLMLQNGNHVEVIRDIIGDDILTYYDTSNYFIDGTSTRLSTSCMNDKFSFLDIYRENSAVNLIAIKHYDKVVGRCLTWTLSDGRKLMDKRYTAFDWVDYIFDKIRIDEGYMNFDTEENIEVDLDKVIFDVYPYVDTFRYLCKKTNKLLNHRSNFRYNYILDRTGGGFNEIN